MSILVCDICGNKTKKFSRRYNNKRYCNSCYQRDFIKGKCSSCLKETRLHKNVQNAICIECEYKKPCIRCGIYKPSRMIKNEYGLVCSSCTIYFKKEENCGSCGKLTRRLSIYKKFNDGLKRCESCARIDFGTCFECHHYRKLIFKNGKKKCLKCHQGKINKCKTCDEDISSGRGNQCLNCYWKQLFEKKVKQNVELIENELMQVSYYEFSKWLIKNIGNHSAALKINKYTLFFKEVENHIGYWPKYIFLLKYFGAEYIRKYRKVIEWLELEKGLLIQENEKSRIIEEQRISKMILRVAEDPYSFKIIKDYEKSLRHRFQQGKIKHRSIRLSLTPAIELLVLSIKNREESLKIETVKKYLSIHPGQTASLSVFLSFCRRECDIDIKFNKNMLQGLRKKHLENKMVLLSKKVWDENDKFNWYLYSLEFFHNLKISKNNLKGSMKEIQEKEDGLEITIKNMEYFIPLPIQKLNFN